MKVVGRKFKKALKSIKGFCNLGYMYEVHKDGRFFYVIDDKDNLISLENEEVVDIFGGY